MPDPLSTHFPRPSAVQLPPGEWATVLDYLCERFPAIDRARWLDRMARHRVLDSNGEVIGPSRSYRAGMQLHYFREVADETPIPVVETILYVDDHLIVVDKPHFLPVVPAGKYVEETLIARLIRRFDNPDIAPLHRIDRHTAGLVLFAANRDSRDLYQALFRERRIEKSYEAIAPALLDAEFPVTRKTRLVAGEPFFRMCEEVGLANTETIINVIERSDSFWRYQLTPVTGKKHQLRVHMAALGAPILNDPIYPVYKADVPDDYEQPLQLLAKTLEFVCPQSGKPQRFDSALALRPLT